MMNHMINAQRRMAAALPQRLQLHHHLRLISTTPTPSALPATGTGSETALTSQKKVTREKRGPSQSKLKAEQSQASRLYDLMIKAYDDPGSKPPQASPEEMERRYHVGRNYNIGSFKRHNEEQHDLAVKIRMKQHALKLLPKGGEVGDETLENGTSLYGGWKSQALSFMVNHGPPDHRHVPMYTPPIEGFDVNLYIDREEEDN